MADTERRNKTFRGISARLAVRYLRKLGGTPQVEGKPAPEADDSDVAVVTGEGWAASVDSEKVQVGSSSLTLTEVRIEFTGEPAALEPLIEAFSQKAMRAGG